jgi:hypothetical protein
VLAVCGALSLSLAASWFLYWAIEEPFHRGFFLSRKQLTSGLVAASLALGLAPSVIIAATKSNIDFKEIRRLNLGLGRPCAFKRGSPPQEVPKECLTNANPKVLVWGDSYAMALVPGLAKSMADLGLAQITMSSCGPALGMATFFAGTAAPDQTTGSTSPSQRSFALDCIRFNDAVLTLLKTLPEVEIVLIASPFAAPVSKGGRMLVRRGEGFEEQATSSAVAIEGIKALVDQVRAMGKRVVVVAPPPSSGVNIGECLERKARGRVILGKYSNCEIPVSDHVAHRSRTLQMLSQLRHDASVEVVSFNDALCDDRFCKTHVDNTFIYRDGGHLSVEGSEVVARLSGLAERLLEAAR